MSTCTVEEKECFIEINPSFIFVYLEKLHVCNSKNRLNRRNKPVLVK